MRGALKLIVNPDEVKTGKWYLRRTVVARGKTKVTKITATGTKEPFVFGLLCYETPAPKVKP
jgi:hypothetical protein